MSENKGFLDRLKEASKTVDNWPEWKKKALGGGPSSARRSGAPATAPVRKPKRNERAAD